MIRCHPTVVTVSVNSAKIDTKNLTKYGHHFRFGMTGLLVLNQNHLTYFLSHF